MTRTYRAALLGAAAVALHVLPATDHANAQQSSSATQLPTVVVKPADTAAGAKRKRRRVPAASAAEAAPAAAEPAPVEFAGPPPASRSDGLASPLSSTVVAGASIDADRVRSNDATSLFSRVPGFSVYQAGGVSGLPVINGLAADRVLVVNGGMSIAAACANFMNPPLSYVDPSQVGKVEVVSGVGPVSKGGDSTAGTIIVEPPDARYARPGEGVRTSGSASVLYRNNGSGIGTTANTEVATASTSLRYEGAWSRSGDYKSGSNGPKVRSTEYEAGNHRLTFNARHFGDEVTVQVGYQAIPYQGYVNQRMDMVDNTAWFANARYLSRLHWGTLETRVFFQNTDHEMGFLVDKQPADMPMRVKQQDYGYSVKAEIPIRSGVIRIGNELRGQHTDDWWPALPGSMMMGPLDYKNINGGERVRLGTYAEWEHKWSRAWSTLLGVRNDVVWMDTGDVQPYSLDPCGMMMSGMGMGMGMCMGNPDLAAADAFNAADRSKTDVNFDTTALVRYEPDDVSAFEFGYARKTRSPNLYERYTWGMGNMAMSMIGWFGDVNGYVGDIDLKPEIAHTASVTAGWHDPGKRLWEVKATPYFTYVEDFIDVDRIGTFTDATGDTFAKLKFANHDARLYGVNVSGKARIYADPAVGWFALGATVGYVHGERTDGGALYHIMPLHAKLELTHRLGGWSNVVEVVAVDDKSRVDLDRNEPMTPGYALVNLRTGYEWDNIRFDLGVDNLFDKTYYSPLGGLDFADYKALGGRIGPVPGIGRSFNAGVTVRF